MHGAPTPMPCNMSLYCLYFHGTFKKKTFICLPGAIGLPHLEPTETDRQCEGCGGQVGISILKITHHKSKMLNPLTFKEQHNSTENSKWEKIQLSLLLLDLI